jgi:hypothetical protein
VTYYGRDPETDRLRVVGINGNFSLRLEVQQVTDFVVTGKATITGSDPNVDLSGSFRLVNKLGDPEPNDITKVMTDG